MTSHLIRPLSAAAIALSLGACGQIVEYQVPTAPVPWGERLAQRNCGECHALGRTDRSALADAPPFRDLRPKYSRTDMDAILQERMVQIHPRMPLLKLDEDELHAFLDYWQTLQPAAGESARGQ